MAMRKLFLAGFGGQGVLLMGQIIAYAGMMEGKEVTFMPSYGPEMRGGTANCTVIVSDSPISCPIITEADVLVAMNLPSLVKFESLLKPKGRLFINSSLVEKQPERKDVTTYHINLSELAAELKNDKVANMIMLGAIVRSSGVVKLSSVEKAMEKLFTGSKAKLLPLNREALRVWADVPEEQAAGL